MPEWMPAPARLRPESHEVHVWRARLDLPAARLSSLAQTLAHDECARAERFHFVRDRKRFIAARGILRDVLARYVGISPAQIRLRYDPQGKPSLDGDLLQFNLSHSDDLTLVGVALGRAVGVDVERVRSGAADERMAKRFFSPRETEILLKLPASCRPPAFFRCWTRKEAFVKARGDGLSFPLDQFDVSLAPGAPAALLRVADEPEAPSQWRLEDLGEPGPGYVAAVAVQGHDWQLICWQWETGLPKTQRVPG